MTRTASTRVAATLAALALPLAFAPTAGADSVILQSTGTTNTSATASNDAGIAVQFTLNQATKIDQVSLELASSGLDIPKADLFLQVYSNNSANNDFGTYDAEIAAAPADLDTGSFESVAFVSGSGVNLAAGTYWLFLFDTSSNAVYWQTNKNGTYSGPDGSVSGKIYAGGYYTDHPTFTMDGTAVPEPASLAMLGLGLTLAGACAWKSRSRLRRSPSPSYRWKTSSNGVRDTGLAECVRGLRAVNGHGS